MKNHVWRRKKNVLGRNITWPSKDFFLQTSDLKIEEAKHIQPSLTNNDDEENEIHWTLNGLLFISLYLLTYYNVPPLTCGYSLVTLYTYFFSDVFVLFRGKKLDHLHSNCYFRKHWAKWDEPNRKLEKTNHSL